MASATAGPHLRGPKFTARYPRQRPTLMSYLGTRNRRPYKNLSVADLARNHEPFLHRMNYMKNLPVHDGCVNTIQWNRTGEYILSGSDDCNLCITKPTYLFDSSEDYTVLHKVPTKHLGNIFSARFIPNSGDQQIVSCSSEGPVIVHDICSTDPSEAVLTFNCHSSTIYEVVTVPDDDKTFLTCGEDKTVRLFDMRVHSSCARSGTCPHPALIRNSHAMTTLTLHPLNSNLMLIGRADGVGLVYDRRKLPDVSKFSRERAHLERLAGIPSAKFRFMHPLDGVVAQFMVPEMDERYRFTSLCYNNNGTEVLASYSGDYVYLFSHDRSSNVELIQTLPKRGPEGNRDPGTSSETNMAAEPVGGAGVRPPGESSGVEGARQQRRRPDERAGASERSLSSRAARISRIRVRGDWSNTGVSSVPFSRRARGSAGSSANNNDGDDDDDDDDDEDSGQISVMLGNRRLGRRPHFIPITELIAGPIEYGGGRNESSSNTSDPSSRSLPSERTIEEEEEGERENGHDDEEEEEEDDDDDDDNSTVIDECESAEDANMDEDETDERREFERAQIMVENLIVEADERCRTRRHMRRARPDEPARGTGEPRPSPPCGPETSRAGHNTYSSRCSSSSSGSSSGSSNNNNNNTDQVASNARAKFRRAVDGLRSKFNHIPAHKPRVKYQGHRNSRTSIKEAIFWGDNYVMSGSDCGRIMVWEKDTARLMMAFPADERVVNCLAPNPRHYVLASSGIDYDIKLWSTQSLSEGPLKASDQHLSKIVENNEMMLEEAKHTISVPPHLFFRVLASLVNSSR